ncbi:hypothetical protein ACFE04_020952 [Oxalis oulophora]
MSHPCRGFSMLSFRCRDVLSNCLTRAWVLEYCRYLRGRPRSIRAMNCRSTALEDYNETETYEETLTSFLRRQAPYSPYMVPLVIVHHSHVTLSHSWARSPVFLTGWLVISYDKDVVVPNMEVSSRVSTRGPEEARVLARPMTHVVSSDNRSTMEEGS